MFVNIVEKRVALLGRSRRIARPHPRSFSVGYPKLGESSSSSSTSSSPLISEETQYNPSFQVDYIADLKGDHGAKRGGQNGDTEDVTSSTEGILEPESFGVSRPRANSDLRRAFYSTPNEQPESYYRDKVGAQVPGWTPSTLKAFTAPSTSSTPGSARQLRGVHKRHARSLGQTPSEAAKFNEVLATIFADLERTHGPLNAGSTPTSDPYGAQFGVGRNLFRASQVVGRRQAEEDELDELTVAEFDRMKEEMSSLTTDVEVLEWAKEHVFKTTKSEEDGEESYPRSYPFILEHTIRTLRQYYENPHLALALFLHAQSTSMLSYLSGCHTGAYNEVLTIRWESFKDLEGVEQGVREMDMNGVGWNRKTRQIVARVCEEVSRSMLVSRDGGAGGMKTEPDQATEQRLANLEKRVYADMKREQWIHKEKTRKKSLPVKHGALFNDPARRPWGQKPAGREAYRQ